MEKKRPQLSLVDLYRLKWLLGGLLVLLSISTVLYLEIDAWILMGLTAGAVGLGLVKPALPARLPRAVHWLAFCVHPSAVVLRRPPQNAQPASPVHLRQPSDIPLRRRNKVTGHEIGDATGGDGP